MRSHSRFALKYACRYLQGILDSNDSLTYTEREFLCEVIYKIQFIAASHNIPF